MLDFLGNIGGFIMTPLYYLTSVRPARLAQAVRRAIFGPETGIAWVLSIIGLTLVIRAALIPLFVKQIKSSRNMQLLQPKVKELQKKYGHDRERLAAGDDGALQGDGHQPVRLLPADPAADADLPGAVPADRPGGEERRGPTGADDDDAGRRSSRNATFLGAKISDTLHSAPTSIERAGPRRRSWCVAMTATTFLTQRQLMSKNMPADALTGPYAQQQKMLLYVLPVVFAVGGIAFPIGVLFYWTTSNLWTMGQQFYVIRNNPAPGTPAAKAKQERDAAQARAQGLCPTRTTTLEPAPEAEVATDAARRQQPKKQTRSQRRKQTPPGTRPTAAGHPADGAGRTTTASSPGGQRLTRYAVQ